MMNLRTADGVVSQTTSPNAVWLACRKFVITVCKIFYAKFSPNCLSDRMSKVLSRTDGSCD